MSRVIPQQLQQYNTSPTHCDHLRNSQDFVHLKPKTLLHYLIKLKLFYLLQKLSLRLHRIPWVFHVHRNPRVLQVFQVCGHPGYILHGKLSSDNTTTSREMTKENQNRLSDPCSMSQWRWRHAWLRGRGCACSSAAVPAGRSSHAAARLQTRMSSSCVPWSWCPDDSCLPSPWSAARLHQRTNISIIYASYTALAAWRYW